MMKQKIAYILMFLIVASIYYIYSKLAHLSISIFSILVLSLVAVGTVWLYSKIKNKKD